MNNNALKHPITLITAGPTYLDIDAYACMVALAELLRLKGENAVAYSQAPGNYSICPSLIHCEDVQNVLPNGWDEQSAQYIVVDVSDPYYIGDSIPLDRIIAIYDHHAGFEEYWTNRVGESAYIEFVGAAATLIYREWKKTGLQDSMSRSTALLLIAAILDNTLNLTSSNTTPEDIAVFQELCQKENVDEAWCTAYFAEVQSRVEADLKNALLSDLKTIRPNDILPSKIAQLCVWDARSVLNRLSEIQGWFAELFDSWMLNIIDIQHNRSYFVCNDNRYQNEIGSIFNTHFDSGVAKLSKSYLRKEIIKKYSSKMNTEDSQ